MPKILALLIIIPLSSLSITGYSNVLAGQSKNRLIVYYFHRTVRCPSCILLEELTRDAVKSGFEPEMKNGRVELKIINVDDSTNAHFEAHYNLSVQSVILSMVVNGDEKKWKNLDHVWEYLHEEDKLIHYIQNEIHLYLNGAKG